MLKRALCTGMALLAGLFFVLPVSAEDKDPCADIDGAYISRHVPMPHNGILEKRYLEEFDMCQVVVSVPGGGNAPAYIPVGKNVAIVGEVFRLGTGLSDHLIADIEKWSLEETQKELDEIVAFSYTPESASTYVYMFTDPDCPYCERAKAPLKQFADQNAVELKVVFYPLPIHPQAKDKAVKAVCSGMTYEGYLANDYKGEVCGEGAEKVSRSVQFSQKMGINGTPTFIGPSGKRASGFSPGTLKGIL